jgi:phage/plasmid-associated DNA primase
LKNITGDGELKVRKLFKEEENLNIYAKVVFVSNFKIKFNGEDIAMANRICLVPFKATFEINADTQAQMEFFLEKARNAFFTHICLKAREYFQNPNILKSQYWPDVVKQSTFDIIIENNSLQQWIEREVLCEKNYLQALKGDKFKEILKKQTEYFASLNYKESKTEKIGLPYTASYGFYVSFCQREDLQTIDKKLFYEKLNNLQYQQSKYHGTEVLVYVEPNKKWKLALREIIKEPSLFLDYKPPTQEEIEEVREIQNIPSTEAPSTPSQKSLYSPPKRKTPEEPSSMEPEPNTYSFDDEDLDLDE